MARDRLGVSRSPQGRTWPSSRGCPQSRENPQKSGVRLCWVLPGPPSGPRTARQHRPEHSPSPRRCFPTGSRRPLEVPVSPCVAHAGGRPQRRPARPFCPSTVAALTAVGTFRRRPGRSQVCDSPLVCWLLSAERGHGLLSVLLGAAWQGRARRE